MRCGIYVVLLAHNFYYEVTQEEAVRLAWVIETYLEAMHDLYPVSTPKMHYLVHLPELLL